MFLRQNTWSGVSAAPVHRFIDVTITYTHSCGRSFAGYAVSLLAHEKISERARVLRSLMAPLGLNSNGCSEQEKSGFTRATSP
jgi:hypothetical protein